MFVETLAQTPSRLGFALLAVLGLLLVVVILVRDPGAGRLARAGADRPILSGPHRRRGLRRRSVLCAAVIGMVAALWWTGLAPSQTVGAVTPDPALEALPLPPPRVRASGEVVSADELPERARSALALRRAFFAGDIERLERGLGEARAGLPEPAQAEITVSLLLDGLAETRLAIVDPCEDWLRRRPGSYAAHWLCGALWAAAASGTQASAASHRARSTALLEGALQLDPRPVEAHVALAGNRLAAGDRAQAMAHLEQAEAWLPTYLPIHRLRLQHGPDAGTAVARARAAGISGSALLDLEDALTRPAPESPPGAQRAYWENAVRQHPTRARFDHLLRELARSSNWHTAWPVAASMAGAHPQDAGAHFWSAQVSERLALQAEAQAAYRLAAALGHEQALQHLLQSHSRGGRPERVMDLCWHGAALGSPVGANCIAVAYLIEDRSGLDLPHDPGRGYAWHLLAARGGHAGSQFELGRALYRQQLAGIAAQDARRLGRFWLHQAAAQDYAPARRLLESGGAAEQVSGWRAWAARLDPAGVFRAAIDALRSALPFFP